MSDSNPLVTLTPQGLACGPGGFVVDPWQPVETAVITHAHGDHLRHGSARYIVARPGADLARIRLGGDKNVVRLEYGERIRLGEVTVSLHPAGHILGSAQIRIEHGDCVWVLSGDYKREPDPTCAPFEPLTCDVFVSEATFALPVYRWPPATEVFADIAAWWRGNRERGIASVLFCYALGKAQRVLAGLKPLMDETVYLHGAVDTLVGAYRRAGVAMLPTATVGTQKRDYRGALILAPPSAAGTPWMRRFSEHSSGFCSGWMRVRGNRRRRGYDRGFVLSDHADWPALLETCEATGARTVLLTHGHADALCRYLSERGRASHVLATPYGEEEPGTHEGGAAHAAPEGSS